MNRAVVFASLVVGLVVVRWGFQVKRERGVAGSRPQVLRYRWTPGKKLHYSLVIEDKKNSTKSAKIVDVSIGARKGDRVAVDVRLGCTGNTCTPHYSTLLVDQFGNVPASASPADFPLLLLPKNTVTPGDTWTGHQQLEDGKVVLDSQYKYLGINKVEGRTLAEIENHFTLFVKGRTTTGKWSMRLDLADGLPWSSTVHNESDMTWVRS